MILFWTIALGLAALTALPLVAALVRARATDPGDGADGDVALYRAQQDEVARDVARGTLDPTEATRLRTEIARRLLAVDAQHRAAPASRAPVLARRAAAAAAGATVLGGSVALYLWLGAPGYADLPLDGRIAQAEEARAARPLQAPAEAQAAAARPPRTAPDPDTALLMQRLRDTLASRPDDLRGNVLLARNEARLGDFAAAARAQARVVALRGAGVDAADLGDLAEWMILAAGGYVSPEAEAVMDRTLAVAPADGRARYYKGLAAVQVGRPDKAYAIWEALLREGPSDASWVAPIRAQIPRVAALAGMPQDAIPPAEPDAAAVAAAAAMSPEDRAAMVAEMVAGLSNRLATEGGPVEEWARLVAAYGVLGQPDRAAAIWQEGRARFAGDPDAVRLLANAAARAGLPAADGPVDPPAIGPADGASDGSADEPADEPSDPLAGEPADTPADGPNEPSDEAAAGDGG